MNILITGGAGFIGSAFVRMLRSTAVWNRRRLCRDLKFASDALDGIPDRNALRRLIEILEKEAGTVGGR